MKIPVVEKFFGCIELQQATIGIGWGYGIVMSISFLGFLLSLLGSNTHHNGAISTAIISLISITFCVLLVIGASRERASYVRLGMYFMIVHVVLLIITVFVSILSVGLIVLFIYLPLCIYCALTVRSYYLQLEGGSTTPSGGV